MENNQQGLTLILTGIKWKRGERNKVFTILQNFGWGVTVKEVNDTVFELSDLPGWEWEVQMTGVKIPTIDTNPSNR